MKLFQIIALSFFILSCSNSEQEKPFAEEVESAHHKEKFLSHNAIKFDFRLIFGGVDRIDGRMTLLTNSTAGLLEKNDGVKIMFDQCKVYYDNKNLSPSGIVEKSSNIRFDAYTWSYFFLFPYKLTDEGTIWNDYKKKELNGVRYLTEKLTFKSGTGDAPDDWYIVYADKETKLIKVAAYIVTATKSKQEAEQNPHAIEYWDYQEINGVPIATKWNFWEWRENIGLTNKIGSAEISNVEFVELEKDFFIPSKEFIEI